MSMFPPQDLLRQTVELLLLSSIIPPISKQASILFTTYINSDPVLLHIIVSTAEIQLTLFFVSPLSPLSI